MYSSSEEDNISISGSEGRAFLESTVFTIDQRFREVKTYHADGTRDPRRSSFWKKFEREPKASRLVNGLDLAHQNLGSSDEELDLTDFSNRDLESSDVTYDESNLTEKEELILSKLKKVAQEISKKKGALDYGWRIWALVIAGEAALTPFFIKGCLTFLHYSNEGSKDVPGIASINEKGSGPAAFLVNLVLYLYIGYLTMRYGSDSYLAYKLRRSLGISRSTIKALVKGVSTGVFTTFAAYVFYVLGRYADDPFMDASNFIANLDMNLLGSIVMIGAIFNLPKKALQNIEGWFKYFYRKCTGCCSSSSEYSLLSGEDKELRDAFLEEFEKEITYLEELPNNQFNRSLLNDRQTLLKSVENVFERISMGSTDDMSLSTNCFGSCKDATAKTLRSMIYGVAHLGAQFSLGVSNYGLWKLVVKHMPGKLLAIKIPLGTSAFAPFTSLGINMAYETVRDFGEMTEDAGRVVFDKGKALVCKNEGAPIQQKDTYSGWQKLGVGFIFTVAAIFTGVGYGLSWLSSAGGDEINAEGMFPLKSTWSDWANGGGFLLFNGYGFLQIAILFFTFFYMLILFQPGKREVINKAKKFCQFVKSTPEVFNNEGASMAEKGYGIY